MSFSASDGAATAGRIATAAAASVMASTRPFCRESIVILPLRGRHCGQPLFWLHVVQGSSRPRRQVLALGCRLDLDLGRIDAILHALLVCRIRPRILPHEGIMVRHPYLGKGVAVSDKITRHDVV